MAERLDTAAIRRYAEAGHMEPRSTVLALCDALDRQREEADRLRAQIEKNLADYRWHVDQEVAAKQAARTRLDEIRALLDPELQGYGPGEIGCDCWICKVRAILDRGSDD